MMDASPHFAKVPGFKLPGFQVAVTQVGESAGGRSIKIIASICVWRSAKQTKLFGGYSQFRGTL